MNLNEVHKVYFLGIGGIGMSALARYFLHEGRQVAGYDRSPSPLTEALAAEGAAIHFEARPEALAGSDLIIYTPAVPAAFPERVAAEQSGIPLLKRAQALGLISRAHQTLAVAGTHGKTTTSAMLTHLLHAAGLGPHAFLGGIARNFGSNFVAGSSDYLVAEADEYDRSFLQLKPWAAAITAMDPDHLEIYGTPERMREAFHDFAAGCRFLLVQEALAGAGWQRPFQTYGIEAGDYRAANLRFEGLSARFDFAGPQGKAEDMVLHMPGRHNVLNMTAALALASLAGLSAGELRAAVASFSGLQRRFEIHCQRPDFVYVDDYAHHPEEIAAAIGAASQHLPGWKRVVVFQPHLYTRTRDLCEGFAEALRAADTLLLMDLYPAREEPIAGVSSQMILDRMPAGDYRLVSREALTDHIQQAIEAPTVLLTLGAGDIDREVERIRLCFC